MASNNSNVIDKIPPEQRETQQNIQFHDKSDIKTLGIVWNTSSDKFCVSTKPTLFQTQRTPITKRQVSSIIASIFDPIGLISPVTIKYKMFLQTLWN